MTTFLDDESSAEDSQPREYWEFAIGAQLYRIATGNRDLVVGSQIYTAEASARSAQEPASAGDAKDMVVTLRVDHPIVKRYMLGGVPPGVVTVTIYRLQVTSGASEFMWTGNVTSMNIDGRVAKFRIPSRVFDSAKRVLPNLTAGRLCPHVLYDSMCRVNKTTAESILTVISVDGRDVKVDTGNPNIGDYLDNGELQHVASGERMTIRTTTVLNPGVSGVIVMSLQFPIAEIKPGDSVKVYPGCNHTLAECVAKFSNRQNFGGLPRLPRTNIFTTTGKGPGNTGEL